MEGREEAAEEGWAVAGEREREEEGTGERGREAEEGKEREDTERVGGERGAQEREEGEKGEKGWGEEAGWGLGDKGAMGREARARGEKVKAEEGRGALEGKEKGREGTVEGGRKHTLQGNLPASQYPSRQALYRTWRGCQTAPSVSKLPSGVSHSATLGGRWT